MLNKGVLFFFTSIPCLHVCDSSLLLKITFLRYLGLEIYLNVIAETEVQSFGITAGDKNVCSFREELKTAEMTR